MENNEDDLITRIEKKADCDPEFTDEEREIIHKMIKAYRGWIALGWGFKWVTMVLAGLAGAIAAYKTIIEEVRKWLIG